MYPECEYCKYYSQFLIYSNITEIIKSCPMVFRTKRTISFSTKYDKWICSKFKDYYDHD